MNFDFTNYQMIVSGRSRSGARGHCFLGSDEVVLTEGFCTSEIVRIRLDEVKAIVSMPLKSWYWMVGISALISVLSITAAATSDETALIFIAVIFTVPLFLLCLFSASRQTFIITAVQAREVVAVASRRKEAKLLAALIPAIQRAQADLQRGATPVE